MKRGRQSAADLNVVPLDASYSQPELTPIGTLTKEELRIFNHTARQNRHLKPSDIPMLELLAIAYCRCIRSRRKDIAKWDSEVRLVMALATKLRCTVQATVFANAAGRRRAEQTVSYYDRMKEE